MMGGSCDPGEDVLPADLTHATSDAFSRFWFDHDVDPRAVGPRADPSYSWYGGGVQIAFEPARHADNFARLFTGAGALLGRYSPMQLEEGFWAMWSPLVRGGLPAVIWSAKVPWDARERVIRSMVHLFRGLLASEPLETASYMWWDMIAFPLEDLAASDGDAFPDAPKLHRVMFDVVCEILEIEAEPARERRSTGSITCATRTRRA